MTARRLPARPLRSLVPQQRGRPEDQCRVTLLHTDRQALLVVSGEIDLDTVKPLCDALREASLMDLDVLVDLDNVTFIGAAGLNALTSANRGCQSAGQRLQVLTSNPFTLKLLAITELRHLTLPA